MTRRHGIRLLVEPLGMRSYSLSKGSVMFDATSRFHDPLLTSRLEDCGASLSLCRFSSPKANCRRSFRCGPGGSFRARRKVSTVCLLRGDGTTFNGVFIGDVPSFERWDKIIHGQRPRLYACRQTGENQSPSTSRIVRNDQGVRDFNLRVLHDGCMRR